MEKRPDYLSRLRQNPLLWNLTLIAALILILVVLFQSGKSQGLSGAIGGIADSYMAKSKAKSLDAKLAKGTKWVGAVFIILTLVINCMLAAGISA